MKQLYDMILLRYFNFLYNKIEKDAFASYKPGNYINMSQYKPAIIPSHYTQEYMDMLEQNKNAAAVKEVVSTTSMIGQYVPARILSHYTQEYMDMLEQNKNTTVARTIEK